MKAKYKVMNDSPPLYTDEGADPTHASIHGNRFKRIQFRSIVWMCSSHEYITVPKTRIKGVKRTGRFEGVINYTIGYAAPYSKYVNTYKYTSGGYTNVVMKFRK